MITPTYLHIGGRTGDDEMILHAESIGFSGQSYFTTEGRTTYGAWSAYHYLRNRGIEIIDADGQNSLDCNYDYDPS